VRRYGYRRQEFHESAETSFPKNNNLTQPAAKPCAKKFFFIDKGNDATLTGVQKSLENGREQKGSLSYATMQLGWAILRVHIRSRRRTG
jgi:hypothetical protein